MNIKARDNDVVRRAVAGDTFAAIGKHHGISRERARQIFRRTASDADSKIVAARMQPKPKPPKRERVPKTRVHVLVDRDDLDHDSIRAGIAAWVAGTLKVKFERAETRVTIRLDISLPDTLHSKFRNKCDKFGVRPSAAIRAIITALETK